MSQNGQHASTKLVGFAEDISIKERFACNAHGEASHLLVDVNCSAVRPGLLNVLAVVSHRCGVTDNMAWLKGRRHAPALVAVYLAFVTENIFTNQRWEGIMKARTSIEVIAMFDENTLDVFWLVE